MLRILPLKEKDDRTCDECGREWWQLCDYSGCPDVGYHQVRGSIAQVTFRVTLCPLCVTDIVESLYPAMGVDMSVLRANQQYMLDEGKWGIVEESGMVLIVRQAEAEAG